MTLRDYEISKDLASQGQPFYALLMAAMRRADSANLAKLRGSFPGTWDELQARYNAPGGILPGEIPRLPDGVVMVWDRDADVWVKTDAGWVMGAYRCQPPYSWPDLLLTYGPMTYVVDGQRVTVRAAV